MTSYLFQTMILRKFPFSVGIFNYRNNHPESVAYLHDDMFGYIQDSLKWIETFNPDNESELGFNYYGFSIIEKKGAMKFLKLMEAWFLMFSEAPEEIILTGRYTWNNEDDDPKSTGDYEKLSFSKKEVLDTLSKLIEFATKVVTEDYKIIYSGI